MNPANKSSLASFVSTYLTEKGPGVLQDNEVLVLAVGFEDHQRALQIRTGLTRALTSLSSTQEEADSRILLHAISMSNQHSRLIVRADDTDVLVLLIYYAALGSLADKV